MLRMIIKIRWHIAVENRILRVVQTLFYQLPAKFSSLYDADSAIPSLSGSFNQVNSIVLRPTEYQLSPRPPMYLVLFFHKAFLTVPHSLLVGTLQGGDTDVIITHFKRKLRPRETK